ncbi:CRE-LEM-3 protein [Caenorhabditis remanei]|uniref:CRE-LEM-3 protein n=2 Tax=Caenorhabditis TaxID=6237 RepID=E3M3Q8_CAERE|nr:CRE-LEM-3 protein [Caenorhabditis remanei]
MPPNGAITTTPRSRMPPTTPTSGKQRPKKETLHFLASSSSTTSVDAARALLERGANVNAIDREGATPLHYACVHDNVAMAQLFLTFGADPMSADKLGRTAYSIAKGNTLRFLRRYKKTNGQQRLGFFRRFFACHTRNDTFFIVRHQNQDQDLAPIHPTALADAASISFNRGNAITKSYRHAKKKIRATFHALRRSRSNSTATLQDVVMTSEGLRTVTTPSRSAARKPVFSAKRSMSVSDLPKIPDRRDIKEEDRRTRRSPVKKGRVAGRSKTPEATLNPRTPQGRPKRSKSQENQLVAMPKPNPMAYYNTARARNAGLRPAPSAPPLSPTPELKEVKTPRNMKSRSKSPANTTAYFTADDDSIDLLGIDLEKLKITPKSAKKSAKTPTNDSADDDIEVLTPTTVDDGEIRKIRRLRDGELKCELRKFGISPAGPLDARTRRLYEKKLLIERRKISSRGYSPDADVTTCRNSPQLELVLRNGFLPADFASRARKSDETVRKEFSGNGFGYNAFCYLLMDPRILGNNIETVTFERFVRSVFYVGKGSKNRPLAHFIDARNERREQSNKLKTCEKLQTIDELWTLGFGIPRHEISHGVSDEEAFVREASIIEAIKLINLKNKKGGEFHGITKSWDSITKAEFGTLLLDRAHSTLKIEGIRLITEDNLPDSIYPYVTNRRGAAGARTPKTPK